MEHISCSVDPHFLPSLSPDCGELLKELVLRFVSGVVGEIFWRDLVESLGTGGLDGKGVEKKPVGKGQHVEKLQPEQHRDILDMDYST